MKKLILSLAGAAFVAALAINLTLNKADVLAQNKLLLENIEAITALETREQALQACKTTDNPNLGCQVYHYDPETGNSVTWTFYGMVPKQIVQIWL